MSVPSSPGMPPQGARDRVEEANERVCNLEAERTELLRLVRAVRAETPLTEDIADRLGAVGIVSFRDDVLAKLVERLTSANKQFESAREYAVMLHTVGARATESHAKRARVSTDTDQQHTSPARTESSSASAGIPQRDPQ